MVASSIIDVMQLYYLSIFNHHCCIVKHYTIAITNCYVTNHSPSSPSPCHGYANMVTQFLPLQLFYFCSTTAANHLIFIPLPRLATLFLFHCYSYTTNHPPLLFPLAHIIHCFTLSSHLAYHGSA